MVATMQKTRMTPGFLPAQFFLRFINMWRTSSLRAIREWSKAAIANCRPAKTINVSAQIAMKGESGEKVVMSGHRPASHASSELFWSDKSAKGACDKAMERIRGVPL
jgi:hypothetical protein